jgi:L-aspartate oxidase
LVSQAPKEIHKLIELGVEFDTDENGMVLTTLEGGHSHRRILHANGDATGKVIMETVVCQALQKQNIQIFEKTMAISIKKDDDSNVIGVVVLNETEFIFIETSIVVIASGGVGALYKNTTNQVFSTGDGIALAKEVGCELVDMCYIQFHPTAFYDKHIEKRFLISEAVRGEGAILRNDQDEPFMKKFDPRGDLAPRDIVSRGIHKEMTRTKTSHVWLDITMKSKDYLEHRFPTIYKFLSEHNISMEKDHIPVAPVAHYFVGGISADLNGRTNIKGIYACGEVSSTGVHGANRLASNSLLECVVFGKRVAIDINKNHRSNKKHRSTKENSNNEKCEDKGGLSEIKALVDKYDKLAQMICNSEELKLCSYNRYKSSIQQIMSEDVAIIRKESELQIALDSIQKIYVELTKHKKVCTMYYEVMNMCVVSMEIIKDGLAKDSLGCHYKINKKQSNGKSAEVVFMSSLNIFELERNLKSWLEEDMPFGDITSDNIFERKHKGEGDLIAKEEGVLCGIDIYRKIYELIDKEVKLTSNLMDGDLIHVGQKIGTISGPMASVLKGERLGLNIMQRLSGIATMAHSYSKEIEAFKTEIVDTRKTTPGLRSLEKYAVRVGGCTNHRFSLSDAVLIKDNHIAGAGSIGKAVDMVKKNIAHTVKIEVETEDLDEVLEAITAKADIIMLDNMDNEMTRKAVELIRSKSSYITIEASGNMTLDRLKDVAKTGVDIISVGALTHSVSALDISLKFKK